jgi:predicted transcriptional regulator
METYEKGKSIAEFYNTKVKNIMQRITTQSPRIEKTTEVPRVLSCLISSDHVWVMDSTEPTQLIGVITQFDTIGFFSPPLTSSELFENPDSRSLQFGMMLTAEQIMSQKPVTASEDETIRELIVRMKEYKIKQLPIVDDSNRLLGEVSLAHIIRYYSDHYSEKKLLD